MAWVYADDIVLNYDQGVHEQINPLISQNSITTNKIHLEFILPTMTKVKVSIYDATGRLSRILLDRRLSSGSHSFDVSLNLPTGVYFYTFESLGHKENGKLVIIH